MGEKYTVDAAFYPWKGSYDETKSCDTLNECIKIIKDFQKRGLWIIDVRIREKTT